MAISFVASSCRISSASTLSISVNRPSTFQNADIFVAVIAKADEIAITGPTGWKQAVQVGSATGDDRAIGVWYKVITDSVSEPTKYQWTTVTTAAPWTAGIMVLRGVNNTNPYGISGIAASPNDNTPDTPSITPPASNSLIITAAVVTGTVTTFTQPPGTTKPWQLPVVGGNSMVAYYIQPGASGTNDRTWTTNGATGVENIALQVSFNPSTSISSVISRTHTSFLTRCINSDKVTWSMRSGQFNLMSGMCARSSNPTEWTWFRFSSSISYFYPTGIIVWKWVSGNAYT